MRLRGGGQRTSKADEEDNSGEDQRDDTRSGLRTLEEEELLVPAAARARGVGRVRHHAQHVSMDTGGSNSNALSGAAAARWHAAHSVPRSLGPAAPAAASAGDLVAPVSQQLVAPYHWPMLPAPSPSPHLPEPPDMSSTPQIVLQSSSAMVVYDPPAQELVVYKHPNSPPRATAAAAVDATAAVSGALPLSGAAAAMFQAARYRGGGGGGGGGGLQPFNPPYIDFDELHAPNVCRLCHRPFWSAYPGGGADDDGHYDMTAAAAAAASSRPFISRDYFHLLHATEEAAEASREEEEEAARRGRSRSTVRGRKTSARGDMSEVKGGAGSRSRRAVSPRRPRRGVEIEEMSDASYQSPGVRTRRAAAAAGGSDGGMSAIDLPVVRASQGRASRAGVGMRLRRQREGSDDTDTHSSTADAEDVLRAEPVVLEEEEEGGRDSERSSDEGDENTSSAVSGADPDEVLDCGLRRSSFNSGYYARFFREVSKLGAGGVGGVYLTHHVLDNVTLGTYAVKKIPVGNSRPWLLQVLKEVRALEGLHHRHIIAYKHSWLEERYRPADFGPEVPCLFLLMEYANRGTLASLIWPKNASAASGATGGAAGSAAGAGGSASAAASRRSQRAHAAAGSSALPVPHVMPEEEVWSVFIGACLGLRHLHRSGVIHRDLKPENLLLTTETDALGREHGLRVLVSDFGNAILKGVPYARTGNTGTLAYSAPETLVPENYRMAGAGMPPAGSPLAASSAGSPSTTATRPLSVESDEAQDLWSVGVILYAMAFGTLPFVANSPEALYAEIRARIGPGSGVGLEGMPLPSHPPRSNDMKLIIRQLLSFDPAQRPTLDVLLMRPALAQRRQARSAEFQQLQRESRRAARAAMMGGGISTSAESLRPPGQGSDGVERSNALVVSPSLLGAPVPRSSRSASPGPVSLSLGAPVGSPSNSPHDSPVLGGESPPSRSLRHRRSDSAESTSSRAGASASSTALVLMSGSLSPTSAARASMELSRPLRAVLAAITAMHKLLFAPSRRGGAEEAEDGVACWRCQWSTTAEGAAHLAVFVLRLWLCASMLVWTSPLSASPSGVVALHLHLFPVVLLSLAVFFSTPLSFAMQWLALYMAPTPSRGALERRSGAGSRWLHRAHHWASLTPWRWSVVRLGVTATAGALTTLWLLLGGWGLSWHGLNGLVVLLQCTAVLATFLAAHPSHSSLRHQRTSSRAAGRVPLHPGSGGGAAAAAPAPLRSSKLKLSRSLSPLRVSTRSPSAIELPEAGGVAGSGAVGAGAGVSTPTVLARVPLLLPPMPTPSGTPALVERDSPQVTPTPFQPSPLHSQPSSVGPHIVRRPLLMDESLARRLR